MDIKTMRQWISDAYPGQAWRDKVAKMSDNQVYATYRSIIERNRLRSKS